MRPVAKDTSYSPGMLCQGAGAGNGTKVPCPPRHLLLARILGEGHRPRASVLARGRAQAEKTV